MEIIEKFLTVDSKSQILDTLAEQCEQLGFKHFVYTPLLGGASTEKVFKGESKILKGDDLMGQNMLIGCPLPWLNRYQEARYDEIDPVIKFVSRSTLPVFWDDANRSEPKNIVFDEAREHGLKQGITVSVYGPGGQRALFSASSDVPPTAESLPRMATASMIQLTANYVSEALLRLEERNRMPVSAFSAREKDCLQWAASGKTSWEIAQILLISERTVIFHLANAASKLGASNRRQAVVRALTLRLIHP